MKRTIIGCFLTAIGAISSLLLMLIASQNLVDSWVTSMGRLMSTIAKFNLMFPFVLSVVLFGLGLVILGVEYFKKD